MSRPPPRVLVSGAGVAGLSAAIRLGQLGIRPTVVEKAPEIRADGFIITLSHRCCELARTLGILRDLEAVANDVARSSYHDRRGRAILELDYTRLFADRSTLQIMRDDLQAVLYENAAGHADFIFSNSVHAVRETAREAVVTLEDGREDAFDVVIGADGVHSGVRDVVFAPGEVVRHDLGLHAAAFRAPNTLGLERKYEAYLEPERHTIVYTTRDGDIAGIFIWRAGRDALPLDFDARVAHLAEVYRDANPRIRRLIDTLSPRTRLYMDGLVQIEMPCWHKGRAVLTGDAAHALTQLSGQGASLAVESACTLAANIARMPPEEAFRAYELAVRPRPALLQPRVRRNAKWYVPRTRLQYLGRDLAFRLVPDAAWVRYFRSKYAAQ